LHSQTTPHLVNKLYAETHIAREYFCFKHHLFGSAEARMLGDGFMCMEVALQNVSQKQKHDFKNTVELPFNVPQLKIPPLMCNFNNPKSINPVLNSLNLVFKFRFPQGSLKWGLFCTSQ
jgi:hypothetical protein